MNSELILFHQQVIKCNTPEELFGEYKGSIDELLSQLKTAYRKFALIAHEDRYKRPDEKRLCHIAFTKLNELHQKAITRIKDGIYGTKSKPFEPIILKSKKSIYNLDSVLAGGDISSVYNGTKDKQPIVIKISNHSNYNDFLELEKIHLTKLNEAAKASVSYKHFIPTLMDSFKVQYGADKRQVNIFEAKENLHSLTEVNSHFPEGVDPRHFVWIYNRLLTTLSFIHSQGIIHGSVIPTHVLVHPIDHSIKLVDWCFSTDVGNNVLAVSKGWGWTYPPEIIGKKPVSSASDIYMAAKAMFYILGINEGDDKQKKIHPKFYRLLTSCLINNPVRRPQSAWEIFKEVQTISEEVFGKRKYVELKLA